MSKVSLDEMWRTIEEHGFDRKKLEQTDPDHETIFRLYKAIRDIHKKEQESKHSPDWVPSSN